MRLLIFLVLSQYGLGFNKKLIKITFYAEDVFSWFIFGFNFVLKIEDNLCLFGLSLTETNQPKKTLPSGEVINSYS